MIAALYGTGIRPGDRFFCPSSPAWGHGLWHGTLAPLALGVQTGVYAGRFDAERLLQRLQDFGITNLSAAATHYRMMKNVGRGVALSRSRCSKLSFTGEPIDSDTLTFAEARVRHAPVQHVWHDRGRRGPRQLSGRRGLRRQAGCARASRCPASSVEVQTPDGERLRSRRDRRDQGLAPRRWFPTKDRGWIDADGYLLPRRPRRRRHHLRRLDHERGRDRGRAAEAPRRARGGGDRRARRDARPGGEGVHRDRPAARATTLATDIQDFVRTRLSQHEYPRLVAFVAELPKTPAGKVNRKALREREAAGADMSDDPTRLFPKITDEALDELRRRIGVRIENTLEPWCHEATRDNIRHYAHGIGDDNPLWCDPDYAANTRWGGIVALPSFPVRHQPDHFGLCRRPAGRARDVGRRRLDLASSRCCATTRSRTEAWLKDLIEHETRFAGRVDPADLSCGFLQSARRHGRRGRQLVLSHRSRPGARARHANTTTVKARPPPHYSRADLARIYQLYARRGGARAPTPRYWEDVPVGDELPTMVKGPMTVTGFIAYAQGWGGLYIRANKLAWKQIHAHPRPRHPQSLRHSRLSRTCALGAGIRAAWSACPALTTTARSAARG